MAEAVTVRIECLPVWGQMATVKALTGVPDNQVRALANSGKVRAKKMDPAAQASATVFRLQDVLDWLEEECPDAPRYAVRES